MIIHLDRSIDQRCLFDAVLYSSFSSCWKGAPIVHFDFCLSVHVKPSLKLDHVMIWWVWPPYESMIWWWWLLDSTAVQWLTGGAILWHNHVLWGTATVENTYKTARNTKTKNTSKESYTYSWYKKNFFGKIVHYFTKEEFIQQQIVAIVV